MNKITVMSLLVAVVLLITSCVDPVTPVQEEAEANPFIGTWVTFDTYTGQVLTDLYQLKVTYNADKTLIMSNPGEDDQTGTYTFSKISDGVYSLKCDFWGNDISSVYFNNETHSYVFDESAIAWKWYKQDSAVNPLIGDWKCSATNTSDYGTVRFDAIYTFEESFLTIEYQVLESTDSRVSPHTYTLADIPYFIERNNPVNISVHYIDTQYNLKIEDIFSISDANNIVLNSNNFIKQ